MNPEIYCSYFHANVCHVCKIDANLKRCSQCKSIAYCSKDHQKLDWKIHKNFCTALSKANRECEFIAIKNFDDHLTVKKLKYRLLCKSLKRRLHNYENQIWMFPRCCEVCFSTNVDIECNKCKSVFFCSEDHKCKFEEIHQKSCDAFKLNLQIGLHQMFNTINTLDIDVCNIPESIQVLPNSLSALVNLYVKDSTLHVENLMDRIRTSSILSPIATILYGLEQSKLIINRQAIKDELTIHIVGGDIYEIGLLWRHMAELGFHWIKNLLKLDFIIIGPQLDYDGTTDKFTYQLCSTCKHKKCQTRCTFHTQLYHKIVNDIKIPDAVVVFNSGINGCETQHFLANGEDLPEYLWTDSIEYLVKHKNIPLIMTDYTSKEIEKDIDVVKTYAKTKVKVLVPPTVNPFANIKPLRDFESQLEPFFYINGFVSIVNGI